MKKRIIYFLLPAFLVFSLVLPPLYAGYHRNSHPHGRKNLIWEPEFPISEDTVITGFWRPRIRRGYEWINAAKDEAGRWHSGYWAPLNQFKMTDRVNSPGYWGPSLREGIIWIKLEDRSEHYPSGSWKPMNTYQTTQPPLKWVPGYWNGTRWVHGYWRIPEKEDQIWIAGYYGLDGRWQEAHWEPRPEQE